MSAKYERMPSYFTIFTVLRFMRIDVRHSLIKKVPSIRRFEKKVPYTFSKIRFDSRDDDDAPRIQLDTFKWTGTPGEENRVVLDCPDGRLVEVDAAGVYARLLRHYVCRPETTIGELTVEHSLAKIPFGDYAPKRINVLRIEIFDKDSIHRRFFDCFQKTHFGRIEIGNQDELSEIFYELETLRMDELRVKSVRHVDNQALIHVVAKKMHVTERLGRNPTRVLNFCEKFQNSPEMEIGSRFNAEYRKTNRFQILEDVNFFKVLTRDMGARRMFWRGGDCHVVQMADGSGEKEIVIRHEAMGDAKRVVVEIVQKGEAKSWSEMSYTDVARRYSRNQIQMLHQVVPTFANPSTIDTIFFSSQLEQKLFVFLFPILYYFFLAYKYFSER